MPQVDDTKTPEPATGEVLIEVAVASIGSVDTYFRGGLYQPFAMPVISSADMAGTVVVVGTGVRNFAEGDHVVGTGIGKDHYSGYVGFAAVPISRLAVLPNDMDLIAVSDAGVVGVTARRTLVDHGGM